MATHRTLEIKIMECDTEELDANKMSVHRAVRYVRVDISDTVLPPESAMQSIAFQAKMEYARQSAKAARAAKKTVSSAKTLVAEVVQKHVKLSDAQRADRIVTLVVLLIVMGLMIVMGLADRARGETFVSDEVKKGLGIIKS